MSMFEQAAQLKLRFETNRGLISVEDLYDLPLSTTKANGVSLDTVAIGVHKALKEATEISFVAEVSAENSVMQLRMDIVKHVIDERKQKNAMRLLAAEKSQKKKRLLEILSNKQDEELQGKSADEIEAMIAAL